MKGYFKVYHYCIFFILTKSPQIKVTNNSNNNNNNKASSGIVGALGEAHYVYLKTEKKEEFIK